MSNISDYYSEYENIEIKKRQLYSYQKEFKFHKQSIDIPKTINNYDQKPFIIRKPRQWKTTKFDIKNLKLYKIIDSPTNSSKIEKNISEYSIEILIIQFLNFL